MRHPPVDLPCSQIYIGNIILLTTSAGVINRYVDHAALRKILATVILPAATTIEMRRLVATEATPLTADMVRKLLRLVPEVVKRALHIRPEGRVAFEHLGIARVAEYVCAHVLGLMPCTVASYIADGYPYLRQPNN